MFEAGLPCRDFKKWVPEELPLKDGALW
jgi:hypothetical protein